MKEIKNAVAAELGYPNWETFYNWISREGERPEVVAQQIEGAMEKVLLYEHSDVSKQSSKTKLQTMKNSKGETLPQPYYDLALMRREKQSGTVDDIKYKDCFDWDLTKERFDFWYNVYYGNTTEIPDASLSELEVWRKVKSAHISISDFDPKTNEKPYAQPVEAVTDYKAMYDELAGRYKDLQWTFSELREQKIELEKRAENATTSDRNWIAECSMRVLAADEISIEHAWDAAEKWAAEGKKRGHLPKTDNA